MIVISQSRADSDLSGYRSKWGCGFVSLNWNLVILWLGLIDLLLKPLNRATSYTQHDNQDLIWILFSHLIRLVQNQFTEHDNLCFEHTALVCQKVLIPDFSEHTAHHVLNELDYHKISIETWTFRSQWNFDAPHICLAWIMNAFNNWMASNLILDIPMLKMAFSIDCKIGVSCITLHTKNKVIVLKVCRCLKLIVGVNLFASIASENGSS